MADPTFDPILEVRRPRAVRLFAPIPPPRRGTALVLEPREGEPVVVDADGRVPDAWLGNYLRSWLVDLADHELAFTESLPAEDPDLAFDAEVRCTCRVDSPGQVVRRRVRDVAATVRPALAAFLRDITAAYDIDAYADAEADLNAQLEFFTADPALHIGPCSVRLHVDPAVRGRAGHPGGRLRLGQMHRGALGRLVTSGDPALAARLLAGVDVTHERIPTISPPPPPSRSVHAMGMVDPEPSGAALRERLIAHLRQNHTKPGGH
ncbi:hypothetical protein [Amycolatopsis albispora]|uniref:Uncharacterized protein n=1 Tax=Amycolatopsis albispora TaxID=1804986 RepID=A0A344LCS5_9PSEU|nr:hypothetical protein [Amycolatopsis albispora]AXB45849.1 hypothetical protein A4R43_27995 [Amycolatopsis albispora]